MLILDVRSPCVPVNRFIILTIINAIIIIITIIINLTIIIAMIIMILILIALF